MRKWTAGSQLKERWSLTALLLLIAGTIFYASIRLWHDVYILGSIPPPPISVFICLAIGASALHAASNIAPIRIKASWPQQAVQDNPEALLGRKTDGRLPRSYLLFTLSFVSISFVLISLSISDADSDYRLVAIAWIAAIILYLMAFGQLSRPATIVQGKSKRSLLIVVVGILVLAVFLRTWKLGSIPWTLSGDEAAQGLEALRVIRGEIRNPFSTGWLSVPTLSFFFNSLTIRTFGATAFGLRLTWAMVGSLTILVTFMLTARMKGAFFALVTAGLLATYHFHIHFSRLGSNQIADPLLAVLSLFFLHRALSSSKAIDWACLGVVSGLSLYFYAGARFVPVLVFAVLMYLLLWRGFRFWRANCRGFFIATGGFLITSGPMLQYAVRFPEIFFERLNWVGILQSGWLLREAELLGVSVGRVLWIQFLRSTMAFNYYSDRTVWYGLETPLLDPFFGALFVIGLLYATFGLISRKAKPWRFAYVFWWWGAILLGGMLTDSPPSSQRLVTLSIPVCYFISLALVRIMENLQAIIPKAKISLTVSLSVLVFAGISLHTYFIDYIPKRIYGGPYAEFATAVSPRIRTLAATHTPYLLGPPYIYSEFATFRYLAPDVQIFDIPEKITEYPHSVCDDRGSAFVILPRRKPELDPLKERCPDGTTIKLHRTADNELIGLIYASP